MQISADDDVLFVNAYNDVFRIKKEVNLRVSEGRGCLHSMPSGSRIGEVNLRVSEGRGCLHTMPSGSRIGEAN